MKEWVKKRESALKRIVKLVAVILKEALSLDATETKMFVFVNPMSLANIVKIV